MDRDRLNEGKFYHFGQVTENLGGVGEEWEEQIGDMFPPNSETRKALIDVLDRHVEGETISNLLKGRKLKVTPFSAKLKEGLTFEGVRGRNYSDVQRQVLREWVELMLEEGIIEPAPSTTTTPVHVVKNAEGKYRVTSDNTVLNSLMETVHGTIPSIDGMVPWFAERKDKGVLDLLRAYFQGPAAEEMRDLYAFSTSEGSFRFTARLPMGDKNIPVYFNNILREILFDIEQAQPYTRVPPAPCPASLHTSQSKRS